MGTAVLILKISFIRFERCVDSENKLYTFLHVVFTRIVYISHISKHDQLSSQVASGQITWARKGHNLLFVNFTFLCHFLK